MRERIYLPFIKIIQTNCGRLDPKPEQALTYV